MKTVLLKGAVREVFLISQYIAIWSGVSIGIPEVGGSGTGVTICIDFF